MKTISKCLLLLIVILVCPRAKGDILVYNQNLKYWYAGESGGEWTVATNRQRGYVVMDVTYDPNGNIETIDDAMQIQYGTTDGSQWYTEAAHDFELSRITGGRSVQWAVVESVAYSGGGEMTVLTGRAKSSRIGFEDPNEAATRLDGKKLSYLPGMGTDTLYTATYSLRLNQSLTRTYNSEGLTYSEALNRIRTMLEEDGYPVPG